MQSIAELIARDIAPEPARVNAPTARLIEAPVLATGNDSDPHAFEVEVFNVLLAQKERLGISALWRCRNARIDGLIDLLDGRRVALEIKYRMNWEKACQACAQIAWYRNRVEGKEKPLSNGVVVFGTFSGDWARRKPTWLLENGWNFFYMDHREVEGLRVDLVRVRDSALESFSTALAAAQAARDPTAGHAAAS
jgi:hypothetical protein